MSAYLGPEFGEWGEWSTCSASCDGGERTRSRNCENWCTNVDDTNSDHTRTQTEACNLDACRKFILPYTIINNDYYCVICNLFTASVQKGAWCTRLDIEI